MVWQGAQRTLMWLGGSLGFSGLVGLLKRVDLKAEGPYCDKKWHPDFQRRLQVGRILCEGALGRATNGNGKSEPYSLYCLVSFCSLSLPNYWCLSVLSCHNPYFCLLPITPFHMSPSLCHLPHLFGNYLLMDSTVLSLPFIWSLLCPLSSLPTVVLLHLFLSLCALSFL